MIDGAWEENTSKIKEEVRRFFELKFQSDGWSRPNLDGVCFNSLSEADNKVLVDPFDEEEITEAV